MKKRKGKLLNVGDEYWSVCFWAGDEWDTYAEVEDNFSTKEKAISYAEERYGDYFEVIEWNIDEEGSMSKNKFHDDGTVSETLYVTKCVYSGFFVDETE